MKGGASILPLPHALEDILLSLANLGISASNLHAEDARDEIEFASRG
jgi:hypothetical protein